MSYKALVTRIQVRPHPNADKLQIGSCAGYQVIVGKDVANNTLGLFFEQGGQLSKEFATANDLVRRKDEQGNPAGGMFEEKRRVKGISLRGVRSEGFWCELDKLAFAGDYSSLTEGEELDVFNEVPICNKYVTPATRSARRAVARKQNRMFAKHIETEQYLRNAHLIPEDALVYVTEKLHGTSARFGYVLDETPIKRNLFGRFLGWLLRWPKTKTEWKYLNGSRNVVLADGATTDGYYNSNFRVEATRGIVLQKGEVIYGEIVGYISPDTTIMARHSTNKLPELKQQYGDVITYSYGCEPGEFKLFVYRITQVNEDGYAVELSWNQVQQRCRQLGLKTVPQIMPVLFGPPGSIHDVCKEGPSCLDNRHVVEGVVLRYESPQGTGWLKYKTYAFGVMEGYLKDRDDYVDTEEAA